MARDPKLPDFDVDGYPRGIDRFDDEARSSVSSRKRDLDKMESFLKKLARSFARPPAGAPKPVLKRRAK